MQSVYRAILHGNHLEWSGEEPKCSRSESGVEVFVTIPDAEGSPDEERSRGAAMAAALERLAQAGGVQSINDPVEWQREIRTDRPLFGRESG
jgi:hypothetical protein